MLEAYDREFAVSKPQADALLAQLDGHQDQISNDCARLKSINPPYMDPAELIFTPDEEDEQLLALVSEMNECHGRMKVLVAGREAVVNKYREVNAMSGLESFCRRQVIGKDNRY